MFRRLAALAVVAMCQCAGCGSSDPEAGRTVVVATSALHASFTTDVELVVGTNAFTLSLSTSEDVPVTGAVVTVEPWMIVHGHGSPEEPAVEELGGGDYTIENVVFTMPGAWELRTSVTFEAADETQLLKPVFEVR